MPIIDYEGLGFDPHHQNFGAGNTAQRYSRTDSDCMPSNQTYGEWLDKRVPKEPLKNVLGASKVPSMPCPRNWLEVIRRFVPKPEAKKRLPAMAQADPAAAAAALRQARQDHKQKPKPKATIAPKPEACEVLRSRVAKAEKKAVPTNLDAQISAKKAELRSLILNFYRLQIPKT